MDFGILVGVRAVHFTAAFIALGGSFFWLVVVPPTVRPVLPRSRAIMVGCVRLAVLALVLSGVTWIGLTLVDMAGSAGGLVDPTVLRAFFFETPFGIAQGIRLGLFAVLFAIVLHPFEQTSRLSIVALLVCVLLASQAWLGHAAEAGSTPYGLAMIAIYAVHVVAAALWLGGIGALLLAVLEAREYDGAIGLELLLRYSTLATIAAACVVTSGIANTIFRIGLAWSALWSSDYGRVLLWKLTAVATILGLGAINRFILAPRIRFGAVAYTGLSTSVVLLGVDLMLSVAVLGLAARLGVTPPPM